MGLLVSNSDVTKPCQCGTPTPPDGGQTQFVHNDSFPSSGNSPSFIYKSPNNISIYPHWTASSAPPPLNLTYKATLSETNNPFPQFDYTEVGLVLDVHGIVAAFDGSVYYYKISLDSALDAHWNALSGGQYAYYKRGNVLQEVVTVSVPSDSVIYTFLSFQ